MKAWVWLAGYGHAADPDDRAGHEHRSCLIYPLTEEGRWLQWAFFHASGPSCICLRGTTLVVWWLLEDGARKAIAQGAREVSSLAEVAAHLRPVEIIDPEHWGEEDNG